MRNLITDLALDILLYQSPVYKRHITRIVVEECNRIYKVWMERNPRFNGRVSLVGHSLGSAIMFDILCNQSMEQRDYSNQSKDSKGLQLDFDVQDLYLFGSPIGLFQMLKGRTIAGRGTPNLRPAQTPFGVPNDPFSTPGVGGTSYAEGTTSSPKCANVYNIFYNSDPIAYRLEPLISQAMASLKPQNLPYTKRGLFTAPVAEGLSGIGNRVGQSVSSMWTSLSSGIASNLVNRSLGISAEDATRLSNPLSHQPSRMSQSNLVNPNALSGSLSSESTLPLSKSAAIGDKKSSKDASLALEVGDEGEHPPTLIDTKLETLFSGFQSRSSEDHGEAGSSDMGDDPDRHELEAESRRLKKEEAKVHALNANKRVDYCIQE